MCVVHICARVANLTTEIADKIKKHSFIVNNGIFIRMYAELRSSRFYSFYPKFSDVMSIFWNNNIYVSEKGAELSPGFFVAKLQ